MTEPQVSVVMPVYNGQRWLAEAIESILAQTLTDFELLVVNDGSTDDSPAILERFAAQDGRLRVISQPNAGISLALNAGLAQARGEFIARMDADDVAMPERFARQVDYLRAHPDCMALGTGLWLIDPDGDVVSQEVPTADHDAIYAELLTGLGGIGHPTAMIRRSAIDRIGGYRAECNGAEDKDLWLRLADIGRLSNLPEPLLRYRMHPGNISFQRYENGLASLRRAICDARQRRGLPPLEQPLSTLPAQLTTVDRHRFWAWSAIRCGYSRVARKYACRVLREQPWDRRSWIVVLYALLGRRAESLRRGYRQWRGLPAEKTL